MYLSMVLPTRILVFSGANWGVIGVGSTFNRQGLAGGNEVIVSSFLLLA